jgi:beta-glucanase (GH16 family)
LMGFPFGGGGQQTLSSNGEGEVYEPSGITQNPDGSVTLTAQPNPNTTAAWPNDLPYTSGAFSTAGFVNSEPQAGGFQALYGYFQMTAELPTGAGLWPAFWLEPTDGVSASEIDVMEAPFNNPTLIQASLHDNVGGYTTGPVTVPNFSTNYNTYGVNWNAQTITYYVNGQVIGSTPTPASANTAHYILANLAVGGQSWSWPGTPNASNTWPASMTIKNITYNPNGPNGVGNDGGTYSGGLVTTSPTTSGGSATSAMVAQSQISDAATSGTTIQLLKGAGAGVSSSSGGQTYVIPAAGNGVEAFTSNILALGDTLNLTTALAATNWNGSTSTLSNYLKVTDSTQAATLSISATSGGSGLAIATIDGATTATLSSLLAHSIT